MNQACEFRLHFESVRAYASGVCGAPTRKGLKKYTNAEGILIDWLIDGLNDKCACKGDHMSMGRPPSDTTGVSTA